MISELFDYFRSSSPKILKDLGYVYSSIALERRARRQQKDWNEHIQNCHALWQKVLQGEKFNKIIILGNGPLTEVPMDLVLDACSELHLVDIVQPRQVKKKWGRHSKIFLHETDVTGVVDWLASCKTKPPASLGFRAPHSQLKGDLVVSANLLSQLSLEPSWYLTKKYGIPADSLFIQELIEKINSEHLEHLRSYGAQKIILYTDVKRDYVSPKGETLETHPSRVVADAQLGKKISEWKWKLCPLGEESNDYEIQMFVAAFEMACSTSSLQE